MGTKRLSIWSTALLCLPLVLVGSCGGGAPKDTRSPVLTGDHVVVEGTISLRGSTPRPMVIVETKDGDEYLVEAEPDLLGELESLSGFPVAIQGELKGVEDDLPQIMAARYELRRLSSGELPVIGTLAVEGDALVLVGADGRRYWIRGDLVGAIREYDGAKIWVVGSLGDAGLRQQPERSVAYWVTGYGVLRDAPERRR